MKTTNAVTDKFEDELDIFIERVYPDVSNEQKADIRMIFFAGAFIFGNVISQEDDPTEEDARITFDYLQRELKNHVS